MVSAYLRTAIGQIKSPAKRKWLHLFEPAHVFGYHVARINMLYSTIMYIYYMQYYKYEYLF